MLSIYVIGIEIEKLQINRNLFLFKTQISFFAISYFLCTYKNLKKEKN